MIAVTFDVEERFHSHLADAGAPRQWTAGDRIAWLVDLLAEHGKTATFFIVGELAERYPRLVRRIADAGHEVASHSQSHLKMAAANRRACETDISRSKEVLEELCGRAVVGYRSPSWTAKLGDDWLWDHLVGLGFRYDSSLFPFPAGLYGSFANPVEPFRLRPELAEIPPTVATLGPLRIPYGGGFYLRLYPAWLTRRLLDRDLGRGRVPVVYVHPWELDADPDEAIEPSRLRRFIGSYGSRHVPARLAELVRRHETITLRDRCAALERQGT